MHDLNKAKPNALLMYSGDTRCGEQSVLIVGIYF